MSPHCDLDLEDSELVFLHDTVAHDNALLSALVTRSLVLINQYGICMAPKHLA